MRKIKVPMKKALVVFIISTCFNLWVSICEIYLWTKQTGDRLDKIWSMNFDARLKLKMKWAGKSWIKRKKMKKKEEKIDQKTY